MAQQSPATAGWEEHVTEPAAILKHQNSASHRIPAPHLFESSDPSTVPRTLPVLPGLSVPQLGQHPDDLEDGPASQNYKLSSGGRQTAGHRARSTKRDLVPNSPQPLLCPNETTAMPTSLNTATYPALGYKTICMQESSPPFTDENQQHQVRDIATSSIQYPKNLSFTLPQPTRNIQQKYGGSEHYALSQASTEAIDCLGPPETALASPRLKQCTALGQVLEDGKPQSEITADDYQGIVPLIDESVESLAMQITRLWPGQAGRATSPKRDNGEHRSCAPYGGSQNHGHQQAHQNPPQARSSDLRPAGDRSDDRGDGDGDDENEDNGDRRRSRKSYIDSDHDAPPTSRRLKCPFYVFDPHYYSHRNTSDTRYRICSSCVLRDIPNLKQHLNRVHARPEHYCARCFEIFSKKSQLDTHLRDVQCVSQRPPFDDRMTEEQGAIIKQRVMGKSVKEKWYSIYDTLFSGASPPPSPFINEDPNANSPDRGGQEPLELFCCRAFDSIMAKLVQAGYEIAQFQMLVGQGLDEAMASSNKVTTVYAPADAAETHGRGRALGTNGAQALDMAGYYAQEFSTAAYTSDHTTGADRQSNAIASGSTTSPTMQAPTNASQHRHLFGSLGSNTAHEVASNLESPPFRSTHPAQLRVQQPHGPGHHLPQGTSEGSLLDLSFSVEETAGEESFALMQWQGYMNSRSQM